MKALIELAVLSLGLPALFRTCQPRNVIVWVWRRRRSRVPMALAAVLAAVAFFAIRT